jgi:Leucine-rich repeat (LRR) protein
VSTQPLDCIDFSDNDIQILGNFPLSPRITTLLLGRNRVSTIQPSVVTAVPNLRHLGLASNSFAELADLELLGSFKNLTHLVLMDNPVTKKEVGLAKCSTAGRDLTPTRVALSTLGHLEVPLGPVP